MLRHLLGGAVIFISLQHFIASALDLMACLPSRQRSEAINETYIKVCLVTTLKVLKIKRQLNFVNASYLFTHISYLEKTYTTTAREPSLYNKYPCVFEY